MTSSVLRSWQYPDEANAQSRTMANIFNARMGKVSHIMTAHTMQDVFFGATGGCGRGAKLLL
jgi:hypothetical protein